MVQTRGAANRAKTAFVDATLGNTDVLSAVTPYLECRGLVALALASRRFGSKFGGAGRSLVEGMARQIVVATQTGEERAALPRREGGSWIELLRELRMLQAPLAFDQLIGDRIAYVNGDRACITSSNPDGWINMMEDNWTGYPCTGLCSSNVMRAGKHYASFSLSGTAIMFYFFLGVVRPMNRRLDVPCWDAFAFWHTQSFSLFNDLVANESRGVPGGTNVDYCMYYALTGGSFWGDFISGDGVRDEQRLEGFSINDGECGLLLDLDEGTLSVYRDGRSLGVLKDGLSGEYCWTATIMAQMISLPEEQNCTVRRAPVPAPL